MGYTGIIKQRATVTAAWFQNDTKNDVFFTPGGARTARPVRRPAGRCHPWCSNCCTARPIRPPAATCPFGAGYGLPSAFSYRKFGKVRQKGVEFGVDGAIRKS